MFDYYKSDLHVSVLPYFCRNIVDYQSKKQISKCWRRTFHWFQPYYDQIPIWNSAIHHIPPKFFGRNATVQNSFYLCLWHHIYTGCPLCSFLMFGFTLLIQTRMIINAKKSTSKISYSISLAYLGFAVLCPKGRAHPQLGTADLTSNKQVDADRHHDPHNNHT